MSKRLAELQRKQHAKLQEVNALLTKSDDEVVSDEDKASFESLKGDIAQLKESIALLKEAQDIEAEEADEVEPVNDDEEDKGNDEEDSEEKSWAPVRKSWTASRRNARTNVPVAKAAPGIRAARYAIAQHIAKTYGAQAGYRFAEQQLGDVTVAKALNTTTQVAGGATIPQDFVAELIDLLRAAAVVRGAGARVIPMPMGNLTFPRLTSAATAQWQDELTNIAASEPGFSNLYFSAKKLTALVPVSNDLLRRSPLSVETVIRDDMVTQLALAEDKAFLFGPGTANQPSGVVTLAAAGNKFTNAVTAPTLATVNDVLMSLELLLTSNNVNTGTAQWFFHPSVRSFLSTLTDSTGSYFFRAELEQNRLLGYPVNTSTQFVTNLGTGPNFQTQIIFASVGDLMIGDTMGIQVDSSDVASYTQGTVQSAFTMDQTVFRCIESVDFQMRYDFSAAVATVTNWRPTGFVANAGAAFTAQTGSTAGTAAKSAKP